ncbi:L-tyrosine/L-tryptophan isonitrile synthase family protein [Burkholderia stagnalis]|uniref:L-tyrosine/L-tryptophan isonitrile synthase family protein n=1 Tax=Burkholderia stagnalis TaxID=1503054 RepID=UPI00162737EC|nr:L-tyrosine/L-tryptophan isonitrile synthase family protein [Burkholderia stagnalis]
MNQRASQFEDHAAVVERFMAVFAARLSREGELARLSPAQRDELATKAHAFVARGEPIRLTLPGFPLKAPLASGKVLGALPDAGERAALAYLDAFCEEVAGFHAPGCLIDLFSDGLTFHDLLGVPREVANRYHHALRELHASRHLVWHSYSSVDPTFERATDSADRALAPYWPEPRALLGDARHARRVASLRGLLARERGLAGAAGQGAAGDAAAGLAEHPAPDLVNHPTVPAGQAAGTPADLEAAARRMAERGIALDAFLAASLPDGIRLTVHDPAPEQRKVPVRMHARRGDAALPWHGVLVYRSNGETIMLSKQAAVDELEVAVIGRAGQPWCGVEGAAPLAEHCDMEIVHGEDFGLLVTPRPSSGRLDCNALSREAVAALTRRYGFVVLRGFEVADEDALVAFTSQFGRPYIWQFGPVHKVIPEEQPNGYVHSFESVPLHWDLSMLPLTHPLVQQDEHFAATLFALHCRKAPQPGEGQTTLVDARAIVRDLDPATLAQWERLSLTYNTKMTYFGGVPRTFPLIAVHPETGEKLLRYQEGSESSLQRFEVDVSTPDPVPEDFVARVNALAYSPKYLVEHEWQDGDIVMVDNYSVLHGRRAMSRDSAARELWRVQVY